jgi:hypothetical protein
MTYHLFGYFFEGLNSFPETCSTHNHKPSSHCPFIYLFLLLFYSVQTKTRIAVNQGRLNVLVQDYPSLWNSSQPKNAWNRTNFPSV